MSYCPNKDMFAMVGCLNPVCLFGCVEDRRRREHELEMAKSLANATKKENQK